MTGPTGPPIGLTPTGTTALLLGVRGEGRVQCEEGRAPPAVRGEATETGTLETTRTIHTGTPETGTTAGTSHPTGIPTDGEVRTAPGMRTGIEIGRDNQLLGLEAWTISNRPRRDPRLRHRWIRPEAGPMESRGRLDYP